jgi:hypothetical protein
MRVGQRLQYVHVASTEWRMCLTFILQYGKDSFTFRLLLTSR